MPQGFVVTASATRHFLTADHIAEINRRLQVLDPDDLEDLYKTCQEIQKMVKDSPLPPDLEELLYVHYARLEKATSSGMPGGPAFKRPRRGYRRRLLCRSLPHRP